MVKTLLALEREPRPDHAADALAVAICHANRAPLSSALAQAGAYPTMAGRPTLQGAGK